MLVEPRLVAATARADNGALESPSKSLGPARLEAELLGSAMMVNAVGHRSSGCDEKQADD